MSKKIKAMELTALCQAFGQTRDYVIVATDKVDSLTDYNFRKTLREKKIRVQLVKNSYAKKIFAENELNAGDVWSGPTLLCWGGANIKELSNAVDATIKDSKKDPKAPDKFKVKTAVADGHPVTLEVAKTLPTREEAIAEVLAAILGPGSSLVAAFQGPGSTVAGIVQAIEDKADQPAEAAPAA